MCPANLADKMTTCDATSVACNKGCGPDLSPSGNLGSKLCSCNLTTGVYNCLACQYPQPLPACYQPALDGGVADPPACAAGVADKAACTTMCGGVCFITTDANKMDGCVCVTVGAKLQWSCQTEWWQ